MDDRPVVSQDRELPSFVKLAIAYLGIMAGIAVIGLVLYLVAAEQTPGEAPVPGQTYVITILFYVFLIAVSTASLKLLMGWRRSGAYLAFIALTLSLFAPYSGPAFQVTVTYWLAIPNAIVGILLFKELKKLEP